MLLALLAGLFCLPAPALSQGALMRVDAHGPVDVRADKVFYNEKTATYSAEGEVEITRGETRLMADRVSLNANTLVAEAQGRVRLSSPAQVITGKSMLVDLNNNTGKIYDGRIFIKTNNYYISGGEIAKTGKETYHIQKGAFTTCEGDNPAWQVTGEDMKVTVEGYGTVKDGTFKVKGVPILWAPYLVFPAKVKRQSGMLAPQFGQTQRDGFSFSLPYYQTLGDDQDATLVVNYYSKRGLDLGLEYRYVLDENSKGLFMIDYLPHDANGQAMFQTGDNSAVYHSRYWLRGMADQKLFNGNMDLKANIDIVSDQDYLREFSFGYSGFNASDRRLAEWFGRNLDPSTSLVRTNTINLTRSWSSATFYAGVLYYDDTSGNNKSTLQSLPTITFDATTQQLGNTAFYFGMGSSFTYYYREEGSTGGITDVNPYISLPLNFNDFLEFEPTFTWYQRFYSVDPNDDPGDPSSSGTNQVYDFSAKASTYLYRVFDFGTAENPYKIKHAFRPNMTYNYRPSLDEDNIPDLAKLGNERTNTISYGINNTLTSKAQGSAVAENGEMESLYREFLRFNIYHSFDITTYRSDDNENHYWGEVSARTEYMPTDNIYFQNTTSWDLYSNAFTQLDFLARVQDKRGDSVTLDYRYDGEGVKQLNTWLKVALTQEWYAGYINRHDFDGGNDYQAQYEIGYSGQCWGFKAFYVDDITTRGFFFVFSLGGFGEILTLGQ